MDRRLLEEWNGKFRVKPPEWVFHFLSDQQPHLLEDIVREISKREANIEQLELELKQERFLLDWLSVTKAKLQEKPSVTSLTNGKRFCYECHIYNYKE